MGKSKFIIKEAPNKSFETKMDQTRFIKKKLKKLKAEKMSMLKKDGDSGLFVPDGIFKGFEPEIEDITTDWIHVKSVINSTNIIDSHLDLHLPEIWNKTVADNPTSHHLESHKRDFQKIIANKAKSYNENSNFKDLGLDIDFDCVINCNEFVFHKSKIKHMFDAYKNGEVNEHSVGMMYVTIDIAYYDEDSQKNMDFFNEMKAKAVNPEVAEERGYFWVVYEGKKREGSAVVFGSNSVTPTLYVKNFEPSEDTRKNKAATKHFLNMLGKEETQPKGNFFNGLIK